MGDGELPTNEFDEIDVPDAVRVGRDGNLLHSNIDVIEDVFGDPIRREDYDTILQRAIFAARNCVVNDYNKT